MRTSRTSATTSSTSLSIDDTTGVTTPYTTYYAYDALGRMTAVGGQRNPDGTVTGPVTVATETTDAFGNVTENWSKQTYTIIAGQAKMTSMTTCESELAIEKYAIHKPHPRPNCVARTPPTGNAMKITSPLIQSEPRAVSGQPSSDEPST